LSLIAMQSSFRGEISINDNEVAVHDIVADRLQEERLARTVFAYDETEGSTAFTHDFDIVK